MEQPTPQNEEVARALARVGTVIGGKWRVERVLGIGGMASVYYAVHQHNQRQVAIKILHQEFCHVDEIRRRFSLEARAANRVNHRGAVPVLDDGVLPNGTPYMVMDFLEGISLQQRWENCECQLSVQEVFGITERLLEILDAAHNAGVLHRDIKPENIFLTTDGEVRLLDFGISKLMDADHQSTKTQVGSTMGTPAFMSPEQARGRWDELDPRGDLFAVGATMYALISGRPIHQAETGNELLLKVMTQPAVELQKVAPQVPEQAARVVNKAIAFDKKHRFANAQEMAQAVHAVNALYQGEFRPQLGSGEVRKGWNTWGETTPQGSAPHRPIMAAFTFPTLTVRQWNARQKWTAAAVALLMTATAVVSYSAVRGQNAAAAMSWSPVFAEEPAVEDRGISPKARNITANTPAPIDLSELPEEESKSKAGKGRGIQAGGVSSTPPPVSRPRGAQLPGSRGKSESANEFDVPESDDVNIDPLSRRR